VVMGPAPSVGKTFKVNVVVKNLDPHWYVVAYQFRLLYNHSLINAVNVEEGPFLKDPSWNKYGTLFTSYNEYDPTYGWNVVVGDFLLPNETTGEYDITSWPNATEAVLATITFEVLYQPYSCTPSNITSTLHLIAFWNDGDSAFVDRDGNYVPTDYSKYVDGTYVIDLYLSSVGRQLDVFGGANNAGYGAKVFPAPYGGQGLNNPMDLVIPQSEVYLYGYLTYNCYPEQSKEVSFEIIDNHGNTWGKFVAITNSTGIASIVFRMPWVCDNPEYYIGEWTVVATANLADVVVTDTMTFHYDYMVHIWKVTTDQYYYKHGDYIQVTVNYGSHAMQNYPALFTVTVTDELGVPIGINATFSTLVGGVAPADYCTYNNGTFTVTIYIPKFAFTGCAYIHVGAFDKEPAEGGFAWCPEYSAQEIYILPE